MRVLIDNFAQFEIIGYIWRKIILADIECCGRRRLINYFGISPEVFWLRGAA